MWGAPVEDEDAIGVADGREAVRYHQGRYAHGIFARENPGPRAPTAYRMIDYTVFQYCTTSVMFSVLHYSITLLVQEEYRLRTRMRSALRTVERRCAITSVVRPSMLLCDQHTAPRQLSNSLST